MTINNRSHHAMLDLLNQSYQQIVAREQFLNIVVNGQDFRPRIEWFHDAVRAFTSGTVPESAARTRLSIESLALDMERLRAIVPNPLHPKVTMRKQSATQAVVLSGDLHDTSEATLRRELAEFYQNYTVFFVALLAETADRNFQARTDEANQQVESLADVEYALRQAQGAVSLDATLRDHGIDAATQAAVKQTLKDKKKPTLNEMLASLKIVQNLIDKSIANMDSAHFSYAASQLAMYEQSKDVVKKLAEKGLNLAGKFVQDSLARQGGRGRGV